MIDDVVSDVIDVMHTADHVECGYSRNNDRRLTAGHSEVFGLVSC